MAARWYCLIGQQQYGPFTGDQIQQLVQQGQLQPVHFVRTETDSQWTPAADLPGLFPAAPAASAAMPVAAAPVAVAPVAAAPAERKKKAAVRPAAAAPPAPMARPAQAVPASPPATARAVPPSAIPVAAPLAVAGAVGPAAAIPVPPAPPVPSAAATHGAHAPGSPGAIPVRPIVASAAATHGAHAPGSPGAIPVQPIVASAAATHGAYAPGSPGAIPVQPIVASAAAAGRGPSGEMLYAQRRRRQKNLRVLVGGLSAALLLLIIFAVVALNRSPSPQADQGRRTAASRAPSGAPEIELPTVLSSGSEPREIADPVPATVTVAAEPESRKSSALPPVSKWLAADRQKAGLVKVVRLGVDRAWRESADDQAAAVHVEVRITNLSPDRPLEFSGWRADVQKQTELQAVLVDDQQTPLPALTPRAAVRRPAARRSIAAGQSELEALSFRLPQREFKYLRLALPYAALGQPGYVGFELPIEMIQASPSGKEEAAAPKPPGIPPETKPATADPDADSAAAAMREEEPEAIPDIRAVIEGDAREMSPTPEPELDQPQPMADAPAP